MANGKPRAKQPLPVGSKEQILGAEDVKHDPAYEVPEWGCSLHLRGFTVAERLQMEEKYTDPDGKISEREMVKQYLLNGLVEPSLDEEAVERIISEKAHHVVQRVFGRISVLNAGDTAAQRSAADLFLG